MKQFIFFMLSMYKNVFSKTLEFLFGKACRFTPTCSEYAREAIETKGIFLGSFLSIKRVIRCNPFTPPGYDPVKP